MKHALSLICMDEIILPIEYCVLTHIKSGCKHTQRNATQRNATQRNATLRHTMLQLENDDALQQLQGHLITCRIAVGPQAGRKVLTPQTILVMEETFEEVALAMTTSQ